jgi:hypothetical protein
VKTECMVGLCICTQKCIGDLLDALPSIMASEIVYGGLLTLFASTAVHLRLAAVNTVRCMVHDAVSYSRAAWALNQHGAYGMHLHEHIATEPVGIQLGKIVSVRTSHFTLYVRTLIIGFLVRVLGTSWIRALGVSAGGGGAVGLRQSGSLGCCVWPASRFCPPCNQQKKIIGLQPASGWR